MCIYIYIGRGRERERCVERERDGSARHGRDLLEARAPRRSAVRGREPHGLGLSVYMCLLMCYVLFIVVIVYDVSLLLHVCLCAFSHSLGLWFICIIVWLLLLYRLFILWLLFGY